MFKRFIKNTVILSLVAVFLITCFVSCTNTDTDDKNGNGDGEKEAPALDISAYSIVRSEDAGTIGKLVSAVKKEILNKTGADLTVITDLTEDYPEQEYEILIGETKRKESEEALKELKEKYKKEAFIIKVSEKKIAIVGHTEDDTIMGINYFIDKIIAKSVKENTLPLESDYRYRKKTGEVIYKSDDLRTIVVVEEESDVYIPADKVLRESCSYGKIIKLEHQSDKKNNGILLASKENGAYASEAKDLRYPLMRSTDDGKTWTEVTRIVDGINSNSVLGYQPFLFELPEDIGNLKKGTILFASCVRIPQTTMVIQYSTDLGDTWSGLCNVEIGGVYNQGGWSSDGLWEPALKYENGRLYCFYSDELENGVGDNHEGGHNQRLVYRYTTDFKKWSEKGECVASETANYRPGMASLTKMGNGKWALVYEMCGLSGYGGCPISIKFADTLDSWDAADDGVVIKNATGNCMNSAPVISWSPAGGECGTLFVTANSSTGSTTDCDFYMSFDYGETFISVPNPIDLSVEGAYTLYCGYSPGMYVDNEGVLYYVNNPQNPLFKWQEKLEFRRIRVY